MTRESPDELLGRLERGDERLWPEGNVSRDRLGWLQVPRAMEREARELRSWAESIDQDTVVLLGMGGSSLGPAVLASFAQTFGSPKGRRVVICDTTDPATVEAAPLEDAFILVSSKSGTTLEPNVLFDYARTRQKSPSRFGIITDPGTPLVKLGEELRVNRIFENTPDIGGRYSVLSYFGIVPAVLAGYDIEELCGRALEVDRLEAVAFGVAMAESAGSGADKATIVVDKAQRAFGLWLEQLLAESTGKQGKGIIPVPTSDDEKGVDRFPVPVTFSEAHELGAAFYRFEVATAIAGHVLSIDPFDEPNVAESKANTARVLGDLPLKPPPSEVPGALHEFLESQLHPGDYVSLQAYLPYGSEETLEALRCVVRDAHGGIPVTAGYGPRFLHSTGQLHKGGPNSIVAVQIVSRSPGPHVPIPDKNYDFATLIAAQSIGDHQSLLSHGRRAVRIAVDDLGELL